MAKIWFLSAPLYSHTDWGGLLKTAQILHKQGHEVTWVSSQRLTGTIQKAGLPFAMIRETGWLWPPPPPPDFSTMPPQDAVTLRYTRALDTWLSEDLVGEAVEAIVDLSETAGKPDGFVIDPFLSGAALAAEKLDVPLVVGGWPAQGNLNEQLLFPVQKTLSSDSRQRIDRLCERFGLEGQNFAIGSTPSVLSPHLHICYFTRDWYQSEADTLLPQNWFVGGKPIQPDDAPPDWLTEIPDDKPLGVVTLGTVFTGDLGFYSWGAQALAREGYVPIVVIGWNPFPKEQKQELINSLPRGSRLLNFVPFEHVLPRTKLMLHHGGMGTTHAAVVHGIPQIVVPHAADQRVQGRRVAQAKVGLNLTAHDVRKGLLWEGTHALSCDDQVQQTAHELAAEMAALGGPQRAAEAILDVIGF